MSLREAALAYARDGWRVLPVQGKRPLVPGGFHSATTSIRQVQQWWEQHPDANIGFDIPEGTFILDFDPRNGAPTPESLGLPDTMRSVTPSGGQHLYYRVPEGLSFVGRYVQGVDVKAPGKGYVLLPPSRDENGVEYVWQNEDDPVDLPREVLAAIVRRGVRGKPFAYDGVDKAGRQYFPWETGSAYGRAVLRNSVQMVRDADNGERNNTLYRAACGVAAFIAGGELDEDNALSEMHAAAIYAGLDPTEALATLRSAYERASQQPRRRPE